MKFDSKISHDFMIPIAVFLITFSIIFVLFSSLNFVQITRDATAGRVNFLFETLLFSLGFLFAPIEKFIRKIAARPLGEDRAFSVGWFPYGFSCSVFDYALANFCAGVIFFTVQISFLQSIDFSISESLVYETILPGTRHDLAFQEFLEVLFGFAPLMSGRETGAIVLVILVFYSGLRCPYWIQRQTYKSTIAYASGWSLLSAISAVLVPLIFQNPDNPNGFLSALGQREPVEYVAAFGIISCVYALGISATLVFTRRAVRRAFFIVAAHPEREAFIEISESYYERSEDDQSSNAFTDKI